MKWRLILIPFFMFCAISGSAQFLKTSDTLNKKRLGLVIGTESVGYLSSFAILNEVWYKYYPRTSFHSFNDLPEWKQMDKAGHMLSSYFLGEVGFTTLNWAGVERRKARIYGGSLGFAYLLTMEVFDGFSKQWGFSWSDVGANALGSSLFIAQDAIWEEQRIRIKFSSHLSPYASYRPNVLGNSILERGLKDYNGQSYWLSANISSFLGDTKIPKFLNVAIGYSANEMIEGRPNSYPLYQGVFQPYRQFYLGLDLDLSRIPTKKRWLKLLLGTVNFIKIPSPSIEFSQKGFKAHWLYF